MASRYGAAVAVAAALLVSGCSTFEGWLGEGEGPPLPGERIAILDYDRGLASDPSVADQQVRLPEPTANGSWPQAGGVPSHVLQHLALSGGDLRVAWTADIGTGDSDDSRILSEPVVVDGVVYAMDGRAQVSAIDAGSGRVVWRADLDAEDEDDGYFGGGLAFANGQLFATTGFGQVIALDARDGKRLWAANVGVPMRAAPSVADGRVYAVTLENQLQVLSAEDGANLWTHTGIQEIAGLLGQASPAISQSTVIVPYSSGEIFALLAENGRVLWNDSLAAVRRTDQANDIAHIRGMPAIDGSLVFAVGHSGRLAAIDLRRGLRAWEVELAGIEMPWVAGDYVFVVGLDGQLVALTKQRGRVRWTQQLPRFRDPEDRDGPIIWAGPVLAGDRLLLANNIGQLWLVSPYDGSVLETRDLPGDVTIAPVVAGGSVFVITTDGTLVALR
jgi:outer membrane protein assembly factor BamB